MLHVKACLLLFREWVCPEITAFDEKLRLHISLWRVPVGVLCLGRRCEFAPCLGYAYPLLAWHAAA